MKASARDATLSLLASRSPDATICPSEIARSIAPADAWRAAMPSVHSAIDDLFDEGAITLSWKGRQLPARSGPYRIGRTAGIRAGEGDPEPDRFVRGPVDDG